MADARIEIEDALSEPRSDRTPAEQPSALCKRVLPGVVAAVAVALALWNSLPATELPARRLAHVAIPMTGQLEERGSNYQLVISPDGTRLVYLAEKDGKRQLYLREIDRPAATAIPGTEGGAQPFFSPDGNWVGFSHEGWLKKVDLRGGPPVTICALGFGPEIAGGSWGTDGSICFSVVDRIQKVPAAGGQPETVDKPDEGKGEFMLHLPEILPGNQAILLTLGPVSAG